MTPTQLARRPRALVMGAGEEHGALVRFLSRSGFDTEAAAAPASSRQPDERVLEACEVALWWLRGDERPGELNPLRSLVNALGSKPILVLTGPRDEGARIEALALGAWDAVPNDLSQGELLVRIRRQLELSGELRALRQEVSSLAQLSVTDGLTGLYNRRFFADRLAEEFLRAHRYRDPLAVVLLDIDHFKQVNDDYGHLAGDEVLRQMGTAVRRSVRETDIATRYGGEELAVILPKTDLDGALTVAERMHSTIQRSSFGPKHDIEVTASLGVAAFPSEGILTAEQLVHTADEALYAAKGAGRNRVCAGEASLSAAG